MEITIDPLNSLIDVLGEIQNARESAIKEGIEYHYMAAQSSAVRNLESDLEKERILWAKIKTFLEK